LHDAPDPSVEDIKGRAINLLDALL